MPAATKRKYTVSEKVLAANRRNLQKANAVPKEIRYRLTPRRLAACRRNLFLAAAAPCRRQTLPKRRSWAWRSARAAARREGQEAQFDEQLAEVERILDPDGTEEQGKLAQAIAEICWRWTGLLRDRVERERCGLMRACAAASPQNPASPDSLAARLLRVFSRQAWIDQAIERAALRLQRLARMYWEMRACPRRILHEAIDDALVRDLGNPFRPMNSPGMAQLLAEPAGAIESKHWFMPELPAEQPWPEPHSHPLAGASQNPGRCADRGHGEEYDAGGFPADFDSFRRMIACGGDLAPLVDELARLSWRRHQAACRALELAEQALLSALQSGYRHMKATQFIDDLLDRLMGKAWRKAGADAARLEQKLGRALRQCLEASRGQPWMAPLSSDRTSVSQKV